LGVRRSEGAEANDCREDSNDTGSFHDHLAIEQLTSADAAAGNAVEPRMPCLPSPPLK
jgi:hypothetical protein